MWYPLHMVCVSLYSTWLIARVEDKPSVTVHPGSPGTSVAVFIDVELSLYLSVSPSSVLLSLPIFSSTLFVSLFSRAGRGQVAHSTAKIRNYSVRCGGSLNMRYPPSLPFDLDQIVRIPLGL